MMDAYSVPCAPENQRQHRTRFCATDYNNGNGRGSVRAGGNFQSAGSFCPGPAVAVPTVKLFCASMLAEQKATRDNKQTIRMSFMAGAV